MFLCFEFTSWQHGRKEVNVELMKEADYFGDIVMVPYMDNYDLVVLKTIAICDYGVSPCYSLLQILFNSPMLFLCIHVSGC